MVVNGDRLRRGELMKRPDSSGYDRHTCHLIFIYTMLGDLLENLFSISFPTRAETAFTLRGKVTIRTISFACGSLAMQIRLMKPGVVATINDIMHAAIFVVGRLRNKNCQESIAVRLNNDVTRCLFESSRILAKNDRVNATSRRLCSLCVI